MAAAESKKSYPKVPAKAWAVLRSRAMSAPSTKFTPSVVASLLNMGSPESARSNVLASLIKLGVLDEDYGLTPLGQKWRVDATYAEACQTMLDSTYPDDLLAFRTADGKPDKTQINTWFSHQGLGSSNAAQMAATYVMVAQKTPPELASTTEAKAGSPKGRAAAPKKSAPSKSKGDDSSQAQTAPPPPPPPPANSGPNVHLDIQIHIPVDATAQQIDQIFASMAKHLYQR